MRTSLARRGEAWRGEARQARRVPARLSQVLLGRLGNAHLGQSGQRAASRVALRPGRLGRAWLYSAGLDRAL